MSSAIFTSIDSPQEWLIFIHRGQSEVFSIKFPTFDRAEEQVMQMLLWRTSKAVPHTFVPLS
jgi:hypothetical protein